MITNLIKRQKTKITKLIFLLLCVTFLVFTFCIVNFFAVAQSDATLSEVKISDKYLVGSTLLVPSATITVGAETKPAMSIMYRPDNSASSLKKQKLSIMGDYKVVYQAEFGDKLVKFDKHFKVYNDQFTVEPKSATLKYGSHPYTPTVNGLNVTLTPGSVFNCNQIINLSGKKYSDNILRLYLTPQELGKMDFERIVVKFIDIYDESNYVMVTGRATTEGIGHGVTYMLAGSGLQPKTGIEYGWGRVHRDNKYGYASTMSFYGVPPSGVPINKDTFEISFDYENRKVFGANSGADNMIIDLDDPLYFTELWNGFTTGEVRMQISADMFLRENASFVITNICGLDLSAKEVNDKTCPVLDIDYGDYSLQTLPNASVGKPYKVFPATSYDSYCGTLDVSTHVYSGYGTSSQAEVNLIDGCFVPKYDGKYVIKYTSTDFSGNTNNKLVQVQADLQYEKPTVKIDSSHVTSGYAGENIPLAKATMSGGNGKLYLTTSVTCESDKKEYAVKNNSFMAEVAGNYIINYVVTDYLGEQSGTMYNVSIAYGKDPVIQEDVTLPKYFVDGNVYTIPMLFANDYHSGKPVKIRAEITAKDKRDNVKINNNIYTPKVNSSGDAVTLTYLFNSGAGSRTKTYTIPTYITKEENNLDLTKYFIHNSDLKLTAKSDLIEFATRTNNTRFEFINPLLADGFSIKFNFDKVAHSAKRLDLLLTDYENAEQQLKISYLYKSATESYIMINDDLKYIVSASFSGAGENDFVFVYDDIIKQIIADNKALNIPIPNFDGFKSGKVYFSAQISEVSGSVKILMKNLNGQILSTVSKDTIKPKIAIKGTFGGENDINSEITLKTALAMDVLDSMVDFSMTVTDPNNEVVTSVDGIKLENIEPNREFKIKLDIYGVYRVAYKASDTANANRPYPFSYALFVVDRESPKIVLSSNMVTEVKKGDSVYIPKATVTDNLSKDIVLYEYLINTDGTMQELSSNNFTAINTGKYTVRYMAFDEYGNTTVLDQTVIVR